MCEAVWKRALPAGLHARSGEEAALRLAGQVGLYSDHINMHNRPDSSRPQAARSRVATREAERVQALPTVAALQ